MGRAAARAACMLRGRDRVAAFTVASVRPSDASAEGRTESGAPPRPEEILDLTPR